MDFELILSMEEVYTRFKVEVWKLHCYWGAILEMPELAALPLPFPFAYDDVLSTLDKTLLQMKNIVDSLPRLPGDSE